MTRSFGSFFFSFQFYRGCILFVPWVCNVCCLDRDVQKVYMASSTGLWKVLGLVPPNPFALPMGGFCIDCSSHRWFGFTLSNPNFFSFFLFLFSLYCSGFVCCLTEFKGGACNGVNNYFLLFVKFC